MLEIAIGSCHHRHPACQMLILRNFNQLPIFDTSSFINKISLFGIWVTESTRDGNYVAERAAEVVPSFHPWFLYLPDWRMILMLKMASLSDKSVTISVFFGSFLNKLL